MALPGRPQTTGYENCRDMLMKLEREIDRYLTVARSGECDPVKVLDVVDTLKDAAFNASVTAWHLTDWIYNDMTVERRERLGPTGLLAFQELARTQCRELRLCELASLPSIG